MNGILFFRYGSGMLIFLSLFSKTVKILKTEYKYGQYSTLLSQSDCRYFFVLAITVNIFAKSSIIFILDTFLQNLHRCGIIILGDLTGDHHSLSTFASPLKKQH